MKLKKHFVGMVWVVLLFAHVQVKPMKHVIENKALTNRTDGR